MARPARRIKVPVKDQQDLRNLLRGGIQQVRVTLRAPILLRLADGITAPQSARLLDDQEKQRIVAMVCSPPPEDQAQWTVRLVREQAIKMKLVPRVGRETSRILLQSHDLKPGREKVVRSRTQ